MSIRRKEELFGDNGAYGNQVPVDGGSTPGYGVTVKGVGFGEGLTSATANRICYALAENDEDLEDRLVVIEAGGLDGVYRLGATDEAGGGRIVYVDGGAVEMVSELETNLAADSANALIRANMLEDNADGSVGLDIVSRAGVLADAGPGAATFGLLDRRALAFDSDATAIGSSQTGILRPGATLNELSVANPAHFSTLSGTELTDLIRRHDLVELLDTDDAGLYVLWEITSATTVLLRTLGGDTPTFAADEAVTFRIFRPVLSSAGRDGVGRASCGVTVAALPLDQERGRFAAGALTLVPGGRNGVRSPQTEQGSSYALRTRVLGHGIDTDTHDTYSGSITATGGFEAINLYETMPDVVARSYLRDFGWPGYRYSALSASSAAVGFLAQMRAVYQNDYGVLALTNLHGRLTGTFFSEDQLRVTTGTAVELDRKAGGVGTLIEVFEVSASETFGVFRVVEVVVTGANVTWRVTTLGGEVPTFTPSAACELVVHEGTALGRFQAACVDSATTADLPEPAVITAAIMGPVPPLDYDEEDVALVTLALGAQSPSPSALLLRGTDRAGQETFAVSGAGVVYGVEVRAPLIEASTQVTGPIVQGVTEVRGPIVRAGTFAFTAPLNLVDIPIPLDLMQEQGPRAAAGDPVAGWYRNGDAGWSIEAPSPYRYLTLPLTGIVPYGATVTKLKLYYRTYTWLSDQSFRCRIYKRDPFEQNADDLGTIVLTAKASTGTLEFTVPTPFQVTRTGPCYGAYLTNRNSTDIPHDDNLMILYGAYVTCSLTGLSP